MSQSSRRRALTVLFYGGLGLLVAGVLLQSFTELLPGGVANRINHNSEGYLLALLLGAWIQFVRDPLRGTRREWPVVAAVAVLGAAIALGLLASDLPSRFRTLNEAFLAAALVIPYVQVRRPLPRHLAAILAGGVLLVVVAGNRTAVITELAETLAALMLAPVAFDIVDRGILDPDATTSPRLRYAWYAALVAVPIGFSVLQYGLDLGGTAGDVTRFGVRLAEMFICVLVLELWFTVGLGRTGRRRGAVEPALVA